MSGAYHSELLRHLGMQASASESEIEMARMALCERLGVPVTTADDTLVLLARRLQDPMSDAHPVSTTSQPRKPAADPQELANIPRRTQTGLQKISNIKTTGQGVMKPLHARQAEQEDGADNLSAQERSGGRASLRESVRISMAEQQPKKVGVFASLVAKLKGFFLRGN